MEFNTVHLTFDTNLSKLPHIGAAPECVKDYALYYHDGSSWVNILAQQGNYFRHRRHRFESVTAQKLRVEVQGTNGIDTARIFELRVYDD